MNTGAVALLLKLGGIVAAIVGFAVFVEWFDETFVKYLGMIIVGLGATAAVIGFKTR